jgi:hypothetical protein
VQLLPSALAFCSVLASQVTLSIGVCETVVLAGLRCSCIVLRTIYKPTALSLIRCRICTIWFQLMGPDIVRVECLSEVLEMASGAVRHVFVPLSAYFAILSLSSLAAHRACPLLDVIVCYWICWLQASQMLCILNSGRVLHDPYCQEAQAAFHVKPHSDLHVGAAL